jgi:hypothetical protein
MRRTGTVKRFVKSIALWLIRNLKERVGSARDVMIIGPTGFRTLVDPKLIYRDEAGNEVRREKFGEIEMEQARDSRLSIHRVYEYHRQQEMGSPLLLLPPFRACAPTQDNLVDPRQGFSGGLHFGGREYFLLTPGRSMCETIGWGTFS